MLPRTFLAARCQHGVWVMATTTCTHIFKSGNNCEAVAGCRAWIVIHGQHSRWMMLWCQLLAKHMPTYVNADSAQRVQDKREPETRVVEILQLYFLIALCGKDQKKKRIIKIKVAIALASSSLKFNRKTEVARTTSGKLLRPCWADKSTTTTTTTKAL